MVYYINNFKSKQDLDDKKKELINNTFKLIVTRNIDIKEEYINNEWKLTITVET